MNRMINDDALCTVSFSTSIIMQRKSYMAKAQKMMRTTLNEKMLAIPTARQIIMERIPSLHTSNVSRLLTRNSSFDLVQVAELLKRAPQELDSYD